MKVEKIVKDCPNCNKTFSYNPCEDRKHGKPRVFCSRFCIQEFKRHTSDCVQCGKNFASNPAVKQKCCSKACSAILRTTGDKAYKNCLQCMNPFSYLKSYDNKIKSGTRKKPREYCSRSCFDKSRIRKSECLNCHEIYESRPSAYRDFCSMKCAGASRSRPTVERFKSGLRHIGNGCITWSPSGNYSPKRYRLINVQGLGMILAHRFSYELENGPIPKGMCVLHKCDNPPCVNADHLFLGTYSDNLIDCIKKERYPGTNLIESDVKEIRRLYGDKVPVKDLAIRYQVGICTIRHIAKRKTWKHVP